MKRVAKTLERSLVAVTLCRPDLISLFDLFAQGDLKVKVTTSEFEFASAEEFLASNNDKSSKFLRIVSRDWNFELVMNTSNARVRVDAESLNFTGLFYKVCALLCKRQKPLYFCFNYMGVLGISAALITFFFISYQEPAFYYLLSGNTASSINTLASWSACMVIGIAWLYYNIPIYLLHHAVYIDRDYPGQGFLARNRDLIIVGLITTILGTILGGLVVLAVQKYLSNIKPV